MIVRVAQIEDVPAIAEAMSEIGMPIDVDVVSRYFFSNDNVDAEAGVNGGLVAHDDDGRVVGYCGLMPCAVYVNGSRHIAYQMGILGIRQGYAVVMFDFMDRVVELTRKALVFANTANEKSVKLWTQYAGFSSGPELDAFVQYTYLPLGLFTRPRFVQQINFRASTFRRFWGDYLSGQKGIITDRAPERLDRVFVPAIQQGRIAVITLQESEQLVGYALLRARHFRRLPWRRYEIIDIVALGDDRQLICRLVKKCKHFAACHGGVMLEYVGGNSLLTHRRPALANTFFWAGGTPDVREAILNGKGWFFGPYDGDRVMT